MDDCLLSNIEKLEKNKSGATRLQWPLNPPKRWHPKKMEHQ
jgi:hypothetical protein